MSNPSCAEHTVTFHSRRSFTAVSSVADARQYFHDLNVLAVRPSTSLSLSMDTTDPLMKIVGDLEADIPFLTGRVDKSARQLTKASTKMLTIHALRQMTVNVGEGHRRNPVRSQAGTGRRPRPRRPAPGRPRLADRILQHLLGRDHRPRDLPDRLLACASRHCRPRQSRAFQAPSFDRQQVLEEQLAIFWTVDWHKSERWARIAGKVTPKGAFSVSGTKEVGYSIYNVLADRDNPNYGRVRQVSPPLNLDYPADSESRAFTVVGSELRLPQTGVKGSRLSRWTRPCR